MVRSATPPRKFDEMPVIMSFGNMNSAILSPTKKFEDCNMSPSEVISEAELSFGKMDVE